MEITENLIETVRSPRGGWCRELLQCFGVSWPPRHGWKRQIIGNEISNENYEKALSITRAVYLESEYGKQALPQTGRRIETKCLQCGNLKILRRGLCKRCRAAQRTLNGVQRGQEQAPGYRIEPKPGEMSETEKAEWFSQKSAPSECPFDL